MIIYYVEDNGLKLKDEYYVEKWNEKSIENIVTILNYYIDNKRVISTVKDEGKLIGFATLNGMRYMVVVASNSTFFVFSDYFKSQFV